MDNNERTDIMIAKDFLRDYASLLFSLAEGMPTEGFRLQQEAHIITDFINRNWSMD